MEQRGAARLLERLIETYTSTAAKLMADAELALAHRDAVMVRHAVHTLRSSSANVGATAIVAALCGDRSCTRAKEERRTPSTSGPRCASNTHVRAGIAGVIELSRTRPSMQWIEP